MFSCKDTVLHYQKTNKRILLTQVLNEDKESEMKQWKCNKGRVTSTINCFARKQELHSCKLVKWPLSRCCPLDALGFKTPQPALNPEYSMGAK